MKSAGQLVREARDAKGWSQDVLADQIGLDRSMVSKIENDNVFVMPEVYQRLTVALPGLDRVDLLTALGYSVAVPWQQRIPKELADIWAALGPAKRLELIEGAHGLLLRQRQLEVLS